MTFSEMAGRTWDLARVFKSSIEGRSWRGLSRVAYADWISSRFSSLVLIPI